MSLRSGLGVALWAGLAAVSWAATTPDAMTLYRQRRYAEARAAFQALLEANPSDADACYYLAMSLQRGPAPSLDAARTWLGKAVKLSPGNETYLAEYAGVTLLMAGRDSSFVLALEGRNAMTKAVSMNPGDVEAIEGLVEFYAKAPWPLGDSDKAMELASQLARRDAKRGSAAYLKIAGFFESQGQADRARAASEAAQRLAPRAAAE